MIAKGRLFQAVALAAVVGVSLGCMASTGKVMDSWVGSNEAALIQAWGPPARTVPDGSGGHILIYVYYRDLGQQPGNVAVDQNGNGQYTAPKEIGYNATRQFYVHADGTIYYWRAQGV